MKDAIKRAIEGGYKSNIDWDFLAKPEIEWSMLQYDMVYGRDCRNIMLLDPLFWQALGKAEGWDEWVCEHCGTGFNGVRDICTQVTCPMHFWSVCVEGYKYHWHRFIDHLAEGNPIDSFFDSLLNNK